MRAWRRPRPWNKHPRRTPPETSPMKRVLPVALLLAWALVISPSAFAESWIFQRSYYSHEPPAPVRIGPRAWGGPYYTRQRGEYVRSGFRNLNSTINIPGGT